jgi:TIR domain
MGQKFFISFNSADQTKAHWIAWTLKEAGHEVAVHDWEIPAGGNAPLWMNTKLAWADRLIAVISPDYLPTRYSPVEWAAQIWNDPAGTKGAVIPVIVRPTPRLPPLLNDLSRIDLTNCPEAEAKSRLLKGVDMPAPPELKPAFEQIVAEAPDSRHAGPAEKPIFIRGNVEDGLPRWLKVSVAIAAIASAVIAGLSFLFSGGPTQRECKTIFGGTTVCGDYKDQRIQERN